MRNNLAIFHLFLATLYILKKKEINDNELKRFQF